MVTFHLLSSSVRYGFWSRGNASRSLPCKSNGVAFEHAAWWYAQSKGHKLGQIRLVPAKWRGQKKEGHANGALRNARSTSVEVDYTTCCGRQCYRWMITVLTHNCPLSPELTSSKRSRIRCFWSLIAILCPQCPKLLCHSLWHVQGPQTCPNIVHKPIQHGAGSSASLPQALPIALCRDRSPARCAVEKLRPARCATANLAALPTTSICFHNFTKRRPILQYPGGLRHALFPAKVAICCTRVLGCHPLPSCIGEALGFNVVSPKQVVVDKVYA